MNKTIHKFPVALGRTQIDSPCGKFLHFGLDPHNVLCVWAIVDLDRVEDRFTPSVVEVVGTGQDVPRGYYIGSVKEDSFMWHAFVQ